MKDAKVCNTAILVLRHYGGEHLGKRRFQFIQEASKAALVALGKT